MRTVRAALQTKLDSGTAALAGCARIVRRDGTVLRVTAHPVDLVIDGDTYLAASGYTESAVNSNAAMTPDNIDLEFVLGAWGVTRADIQAGLFDGAEVYTFYVDFEDIVADDLKLTRGFFGKAELRDNTYQTEFISLISKLDQQVGEQTSPKCRAELGDSQCGVKVDPPLWTATTDMEAQLQGDAKIGDVVKPTTQNGYIFRCTVAGTTGASEPTWIVTGVGDETTDGSVTWVTSEAHILEYAVTGSSGNRFFTASTGLADDYWKGGVAEFLTGLNAGYRKEIKTQTGINFELYEAMPFAIAATDQVKLYRGCTKRLIEDCVSKFNNRYNYRGEPYIPTNAEALSFAGQ